MQRLSKPWVVATCTVALLSLGACTVEQTREGAPPDVDVDVEPGRMPRYDVNWADVDVGTTERTITVPVVRVEQEERTVTVPYIDIDAPGQGEREERTIAVEVDVPQAGYDLRIDQVRAAENTLWVIATLRETGKPAAQAITRVSDQVVVNAPTGLDVRKVVVGQRPPGVYNQQHRFVDTMAAAEQQMPEGARLIYQRGGQGAGQGS